jgi:hypothetical protein
MYPLVNNQAEIQKILIGLGQISDLEPSGYVKEMIENKLHILIIHHDIEWTPYLVNYALRVLGNISYYNSTSSYGDFGSYSVCKVSFVF